MKAALTRGEWQCRCQETFDAEVWHCPICLHHWPLGRTECWNCHVGTLADAKRIRLVSRRVAS